VTGAGEGGSTDRLRVALLEGYWGGSHRAAAEGWAAASRHAVSVLHLPARFWKWRMRGAAFEFARRLRGRLEQVDVLVATNVLDFAHLRALLPDRVPAVLYFHENQAAYPAPEGQKAPERDLSYAFADLAGALAADRVAFNSAYQRDAFFAALEALVRRMPDTRPLWALEEVRAKSAVLPLGAALEDIPPRPEADGGPPLVVWNHRWEYDKDPEAFFRVLGRLAQRGVPFRVAVLGESFRRCPPVFAEARRALGERVERWGFVRDRAEYVGVLARAEVAVSTARQENFGISLVEAAYAGAHPLAPRRLSYPEVLPRELHEGCLYRDEADLEARLDALLTGRRPRVAPKELRALLGACAWQVRSREWDEFVAQVPGGRKVWYT
jgi:glycosyltransferase involved in cell wall biosynthesis